MDNLDQLLDKIADIPLDKWERMYTSLTEHYELKFKGMKVNLHADDIVITDGKGHYASFINTQELRTLFCQLGVAEHAKLKNAKEAEKQFVIDKLTEVFK